MQRRERRFGSPRIRVPEGRRRTFAIASLVAWCLGPPALQSQELVDTLESAAGVRWNDIWFYQTGGKLFVSDETGESVLVYDANTLASLGSISVSSYAGTPRALAGHDAVITLDADGHTRPSACRRSSPPPRRAPTWCSDGGGSGAGCRRCTAGPTSSPRRG